MKSNSNEKKLVRCSMDACIYYIEAQGLGSGMAFCKHPDKSVVRQSGSCPLYRLDWQKKLKNLNLKKI